MRKLQNDVGSSETRVPNTRHPGGPAVMAGRALSQRAGTDHAAHALPSPIACSGLLRLAPTAPSANSAGDGAPPPTLTFVRTEDAPADVLARARHDLDEDFREDVQRNR